MVAAGSYLALSGRGLGVAGDGLIPVETAGMAGCRLVEVGGCHHAGFVPTPGASLRLPAGYAWYDTAAMLDAWLHALA